MPNVRYRPAKAEDAPALAALHRLCFAGAWDAAAFRSLLSTGCGLVAEYGHQATGLILAQVAVDVADIVTFCVHPQHRQQGIGRELLSRLLAALSGRGVATVWLEVRVQNTRAQGLYAQCGFSPVQVRKRYYPDGADAQVWCWRSG